ncbi:MAG: ATP-binding protein [Coriobacteriia bacterium]|nr:ATP-binding protein [Coriobacteriia bacterium]
MLSRKIDAQLLAWKTRLDHKALVVKGARQVGKTFSIDHFARQNYRSYIPINFEETPSLKAIFEGDLDATTIIKQLTLRIPGATIIPGGHTLLFLDEIQSCPQARTALKFLVQDGRLDVIASGSLLGINYAEVSSFPVGYTDQLEMHSLDFEEFCWASGVSHAALTDLLAHYQQRTPIPQATHDYMLQLFKEYIVIGGMPAVVSAFTAHHDFNEALRLQKGVVNDYLDDIAKYAKDAEKAKARACFRSVPRQLAKDYKKFQYSVVEKNGSSRKFAGSLMWLLDAGIITICHNLKRPELPLEGNADEAAFKVYLSDTGLLVSMLEEGSAADIIDGNLGIYKGAIYENIIADVFNKAGRKLYYFEYRHQIEIDFFIRYRGAATAVEVKSAENTKSKSLRAILDNYQVTQAIRLSTKNIGESGPILSLPLYLAPFI